MATNGTGNQRSRKKISDRKAEEVMKDAVIDANASHNNALVLIVGRSPVGCIGGGGGGSRCFLGMHGFLDFLQAHLEYNIDVLVLCRGFYPR
jgi:hypothetical protein